MSFSSLTFSHDRVQVKAATWWTHSLASEPPWAPTAAVSEPTFSSTTGREKKRTRWKRSNEAPRSFIQSNDKISFHITSFLFCFSTPHRRLWPRIETTFHTSYFFDSSESRKRKELRAVRAAVICRGNLPQMCTRSSALCRITGMLLWQPGSRWLGDYCRLWGEAGRRSESAGWSGGRWWDVAARMGFLKPGRDGRMEKMSCFPRFKWL